MRRDGDIHSEVSDDPPPVCLAAAMPAPSRPCRLRDRRRPGLWPQLQAAADDGLDTGPEVSRRTLRATYGYLAVSKATLSGCRYRIQPV